MNTRPTRRECRPHSLPPNVASTLRLAERGRNLQNTGDIEMGVYLSDTGSNHLYGSLFLTNKHKLKIHMFDLFGECSFIVCLMLRYCLLSSRNTWWAMHFACCMFIVCFCFWLGGVFLWSGWNFPAWCSGGRRPWIAGRLSLQRLGIDLPVTHPVWDANLGPLASESWSLVN